MRAPGRHRAGAGDPEAAQLREVDGCGAPRRELARCRIALDLGHVDGRRARLEVRDDEELVTHLQQRAEVRGVRDRGRAVLAEDGLAVLVEDLPEGAVADLLTGAEQGMIADRRRGTVDRHLAGGEHCPLIGIGRRGRDGLEGQAVRRPCGGAGESEPDRQKRRRRMKRRTQHSHPPVLTWVRLTHEDDSSVTFAADRRRGAAPASGLERQKATGSKAVRSGGPSA